MVGFSFSCLLAGLELQIGFYYWDYCCFDRLLWYWLCNSGLHISLNSSSTFDWSMICSATGERRPVLSWYWLLFVDSAGHLPVSTFDDGFVGALSSHTFVLEEAQSSNLLLVHYFLWHLLSLVYSFSQIFIFTDFCLFCFSDFISNLALWSKNLKF